jgi:hypothetical protein
MAHVTLICPPGADEGLISHGTTEYRPYLADPRDPQSAKHVDVPPEVASHFLHKGGFALAQVHIFQSAGSVRMIALHGNPACSWGGQTFLPDEDGAVTVPVEAMAELVNHHFVPYNEALAPQHKEPAAPAPAAPAGKPPKQTADAGGATKHVPDPEGAAHPDGVAPKPEPAPKPVPDAKGGV